MLRHTHPSLSSLHPDSCPWGHSMPLCLMGQLSKQGPPLSAALSAFRVIHSEELKSDGTAGIPNGLRTCLLVATSASNGNHVNSQDNGLLVSQALRRPMELLPPRPALVTLWAWWQGPLLRQLIFLTQQGPLPGIPSVKAAGFYISEGHLGDQLGHSSARVSACTNGVRGAAAAGDRETSRDENCLQRKLVPGGASAGAGALGHPSSAQACSE